jgi:hypothetical protein
MLVAQSDHRSRCMMSWRARAGCLRSALRDRRRRDVGGQYAGSANGRGTDPCVEDAAASSGRHLSTCILFDIFSFPRRPDKHGGGRALPACLPACLPAWCLPLKTISTARTWQSLTESHTHTAGIFCREVPCICCIGFAFMPFCAGGIQQPTPAGRKEEGPEHTCP